MTDMVLRNTSCCGLKEYDGLTDKPEISLETMCLYRYEMGYKSAFILFTDPVINGRGESLKKLIKDLRVGTIVETDEVENPNTDKLLIAYIFTPNDKKLKDWYNELPKPDFKVGDKIVAIDNDYYNITRNGWTGEVVEILSGIEMKVTGEEGISNCEVKMAYFKKLVPETTKETAP